MTIYATRHSTEGVVNENARILAFESRDNAEAWLMAGTVDGLNPRIATGTFRGPWRRAGSVNQGLTPMETEKLCAPFTVEQLDIDPPGAGHSGNVYHFTPTPRVLVLVDGGQ